MKKVRYSCAAEPAKSSEGLEVTLASAALRHVHGVYGPVRLAVRWGQVAARVVLLRLSRLLLRHRRVVDAEEIGELAQRFGLRAHLFRRSSELFRGRGGALGDLIDLRHRAVHLRDACGLL